jgi:hypothetical protein
MVQRIKNVIVSLIAGSAMLFLMLAPASASAAANIQNNLCAGANLSTAECDATAEGTAASSKVESIIATVINIFSLVVGVVSVIMIIIGGLKYITSGGDSGNVTGAKNTILYAVIGLVVVALAQVIVKFVLGRATQ